MPKLLESRIKYLLASILIPVMLCCHACQQDIVFPKEIIRLGTGTSDASVSINFPGSATGSIDLTVECQKYTRGMISFSGQTGKKGRFRES